MSRFAERVDGVPPYEFYDVVKVDDTLWLAGDALYRKDENEFSEVLSGDRISALELDPDGRTLWYAASNKIGYLNVETGEGGDVPIETDFIWSIVYRLGKLWYFGSRGFGWIDTEELEQGDYWEETFSPRPQVMSGGPQQNRIFVSSEKGLWEITASGRHLKVSSDHFGGLFVSWMEPDADGYWLGTADHLYRWSGIAGDLPVRVESDFFDYFSGGTNNSCEFEDSIAVVDYPYGVVVIDRVSGMLSSYVPADQHLGIGDVYKVEKVSNDEFYMLGVTGLARVEVPSETRYLSAKRAFGEEDFRRAVATEDGAILFLDTDWLRLTPEGYTAGTLDYSVNWVGTDPSGNPISGFAYIYQDFKDGAWTSRELPVPVSDLKWGAKRAYAVGPDGVYMAEDGMEFRQIYPDTRRLRLVGEYGAALYLLRGERELIKLEEKRQSWAATPIDLDMDMDVHAFGVGESGVWLATGEILYRVVGNEVIEYPCAAGWQVNAISTFRNQTDFLYYNPAGHQVAIGLFDGKDLRMLSIPYLHRLGEPLSLVSNLSRIGVVGGEEDGVVHEGTNEALYTTVGDVTKAVEALGLGENGRYIAALTFGNVHGVYKPGGVKLRPELLGEIQAGIAEKFGTGEKPLDLVFHGGSGSTDAEIAEAVSNGVVKMNIDTDTQYAFTRAIAGYMFANYDEVLKVDGEVGNKKKYDPRAWGKIAETAMAARVVESTKQLGSFGHSKS